MALRFKNEAIKKHKSIFKLNKSERYDPIFTSFGFDRNTKYKGLCLREYHNGEKHFVVRFRLKGDRKRPRIFPVGKFDPTLSVKTGEVLFGTKECEERLFPIVKSHCDELGRWTKDPNETLKFNKVIKNLTTGETIELFCKDGFPKMREEGKLSGKQIREKARSLIGYNKRVKFLDYDDDEQGDGFVSFKHSRKYNEPAPKNWAELFEKYPSGKGNIKDEWHNRNGVVSMYDSFLSKIKLVDLTGQMIIKFKEDYGGYWTKFEVIENFRRLWKFAIMKGLIDVNVKPDPSRDIQDIKPKKKPYKYKRKIFTDEQMVLLFEITEEASKTIPFQPEAVELIAQTGLREEEAKRLLKDDIKWKHEVSYTKEGKKIETFGDLVLRASITKMDREEFISITAPIQDTLKKILNMGNRTIDNGYSYDLGYYKHIPWLFGTTELKHDRIFEEKYRNSKKTRLKTMTGVWRYIKKRMREKLNIPEEEELLCTGKMLRKTFTHKCKMALKGRSDIAKRHTRHEDESVLERAYDGFTKEEFRESSVDVAGQLIQFNPRKKTG